MRAALLAIVLASGCTLFDDPPDRSCRRHTDCFQAQGERCNLDTNECELVPDAAAREAEPETLEAPIDEVSEAVAGE